MTSRYLLSHDLVREIHAAAVALELPRETLLDSLDRRLAASIPRTAAPASQILIDLGTLNEIPALEDGSVPLHAWLKTALHLAEPRPEAAVFRRALATLGVPVPPPAQTSSAASPPSPTPSPTSPLASPPTPPGSLAADAPADILIVTVLPEEYGAVIAQLTGARLAQGTAGAPNPYAWRLGTLASGGGGDYRVAVALVGGAGSANASQAMTRSVTRWRPRYALLVGIAGGLPTGGCAAGDVVVATEVFGYEYGKLDGGFQARPNWIYQVDPGLRASAQGFAAANPGWAEGLPEPRPKVLFGPIAAGDKVVDDPSDPMFAAALRLWPKLQAVEMEGAGAAAAVEHLRAGGSHVGFLTVRGISDMPRLPAEREGQSAQTGERDANKQRACEAAARFVARWIAAEWPAVPA